MTMKIQKMFLIIISILIIGTNSKVAFAIGKEGSDEYESDELYYVGEQAYPTWKDFPNLYQNRQYLYKINDEPKLIERNLDGYEYTTLNQNTQMVMLPYDNNDNPIDLTPLQNEAEFYKVLEIDGNAVVETDPKKYKVRWETDMGFTYRTVYPYSPYIPSWKVGTKNQNFKDQGLDVQSKLPIVDGGVRPIKNQGLMGVIPKIVDYIQGGQAAPFIFYAPDLVNLIFGWSEDDRNLVANPEDVYGVMEKGAVQFQYERGILSDEEAELWYLDIYHFYPGMKDNLVRKGALGGDPRFDTAARSSQTKLYFKYSNNLELPGKYINGRAQIGYITPVKKVYAYATLTTPSVAPINNLEFYDMKMFDADTNQELSFENVEDLKFGEINNFGIPAPTQNVKFQWRYGYHDSELKNIEVMSLNSRIVTNFYLYDSEMVQVGTLQSILGDKTEGLRGYLAINFKEYIKKAAELGVADFDYVTEMYPELITFREEELVTYEVTIPVSDLEDSGYVMSNTPWQFNNYFENMEYDGRLIYADNSNRIDDVGYIRYEKLALPESDIKIKKVSGFGTWDESLGKYVVSPGSTYKVSVEVVNTGETDTVRINPAVTWDTSEYPMTAQVRSNNTHKTDPQNPKVLVLGSEESLNYTLSVTVPAGAEHNQEFNLGIAIHVQEDDFDNYFVLNDDFRSFEGIVKSGAGNADIGIKDIILKSGSTTYNTPDATGTYKFDPDIQNYTMEIIVEKLAGEAPVLNPQVKLFWQVDADSPNAFNPIVTVPGTLTTVGQTLSYKQNVYAYEQYLYFKASINNAYHLNTTPKTNIENGNDTKEKTYGSGQDFQVSDVIVSPEKLYIPTGDTTIQSGGTVTAKINTVSYGAGTFDNVQVALNSPVLNETKTVNLSTGVDYVSFNLPDRSYSVGDYAFKVTVNGNRAFKEATYENNVGKATLQVKSTIDNIPPYCNGTYTYTSNTWEKRHTIVERNKNWTVCCSKYSGCWDCCKGSTRYFDANPSPKTYTERLNLSTYAASNKTDWNFQRGSIEVNAGRAFEIKWELRYQTNRNQYPRTEDRYDDGSCGGDYTRPTYNAYYFNTPLYIQISGYNFPQFGNFKILYGTYSGTWYNRTVSYQINMQTDALGDYSRKLYTDLNTSNRTITFKSWTEHIRGYALTYNEGTGLNEPLLDCDVFTVKVKDSIDINKKTIE